MANKTKKSVKSRKKNQQEGISVIISKSLLGIAFFVGLGTIIIGGGVIIMKYYNSSVDSRVENSIGTRNEETALNSFKDMSCQKMYDEIEKDLEEANYCEKSQDCDSIMLGGSYIRFGCYHYINKSIDKYQIYEKMDVYNGKCSKMIDKCASAPAAICFAKKCVSPSELLVE